MRNQPLQVEINNGRLVITIGVDLLCFATEHSPAMNWLNITDNDTFVKEVLNELLAEEEDGTTLVHRMFDAAATQACENGAEGCECD